MSVLDVLYSILIMPLQLSFEVLYVITNSFIGNPGMSIIALSLMMNFLVLPLYMRADAMQEAERDMENKLRDGIAHIKATFKGDERMMMLQTYYRQNDYRPTDVFKGSISLFLEIPFFISAYMFLSHNQIIQGVPFGIISDLGAPDGLLAIGDFHINVLPFVMTGINLISCVLFTKGMPRKTKIQLYGMALFFLVFLYASPAGLVFYWTLNNVFALVKTIFYKLKNPKKVLIIMFAVIGVVLVAAGIYSLGSLSKLKCITILALGLACMAPLLIVVVKKRIKLPFKTVERQPNKAVFMAGVIFLTILLGVLIPSSVISSSPQEFIDVHYFLHPNWLLLSSGCIAAGMFLVWFSVFYWLCSPKAKVYFEVGVWVICVCAVVNYMCFGADLGMLSSTLKYEGGIVFTLDEKLLNTAVIVVLTAALAFVGLRFRKATATILSVAALAIAGMSVLNISTIVSSIDDAMASINSLQENEMTFELSKENENVVVIMMDRGLSQLVPYLVNENPKLEQQFSGFTFYPDTLSYGIATNVGTPGLYGGYEYVPELMNKRSDEWLGDKQNEALRVMPLNFDDNDFDVTVVNPTYAGYHWTPDLSIYDDRPDIKAYMTQGMFSESGKTQVELNKRNFFCFSVTKVSPLIAQGILYQSGRYNYSGKIQQLINMEAFETENSEGVSGADGDSSVEEGTSSVERLDSEATAEDAAESKPSLVVDAADGEKALIEMTGQTYSEGGMKAEGLESSFMDSYSVLYNLPNITKAVDKSEGTFIMFANDTTHDAILLQEPSYTPSPVVDNTQYEAEHADRYWLNGNHITVKNYDQLRHYQTNMAALMQLGRWFDYLKEIGVYDNTRIIVVSDHGANWHYEEENVFKDNWGDHQDMGGFNALLMVKDFGETEFKTSSDFMTNADVPTLAFAGLIANPVNPGTGKLITNADKFAGPQHVYESWDWNVDENNGNTFMEGGRWYSISGSMRDKHNWLRINDPSK